MKFLQSIGSRFLAMFVVILLLGASDLAVASGYVGLSKGEVSYSEDEIDFDFETAALILGTEVNDNFAVELRYGEGTEEDSFIGLLDVDIDSFVGIYGKVLLANETNVTPYLLFGKTKGKLEAEYLGSDTVRDWSYGFGIDFAVSESLDTGVEYIKYLDKDGVSVDAINAALRWNF